MNPLRNGFLENGPALRQSVRTAWPADERPNGFPLTTPGADPLESIRLRINDFIERRQTRDRKNHGKESKQEDQECLFHRDPSTSFKAPQDFEGFEEVAV